ncbi:Uma2 family endonuclease [Mucilaginibacter sp. HMF7410]|uniref:Uma2 family endonuclease n=2 Tax=Mucilaginibacter arboris TaxID=2682090 RepID=A0A7K1STF3_9SPHI|nr:Uma2 family endonuclease [Mucilaginibacter arboris]
MQLSDLDFDKTYTYADYLQWTFEDRLEILKGKLFKMTPAPGRFHQRLSGILFKKFSIFLERKPCHVYSAPFDVRFSRKNASDETITTVLQPDISVICDLSKLDDRGCIGTPDIVVEILSPGNNKKELRNKYEIYEEAGVQEYWIVWPVSQSFLKYTLNEAGKYIPSKVLTSGDEVTTPVLPGFVLNLEEVFEEASL